MENVSNITKKTMSNGTKISLVYLISIIGGIVFAAPTGKLYDIIFKPKRIGGALLFPDVGPSFEGFIYSYLFIVPLLLTLLIRGNKRIFYAWLIGVGWLGGLFILGGGWSELLFLLILSSLGYFLGRGILFLKNLVTKPR